MPEKSIPVEGDVFEQYITLQNIADLVKEGQYVIETINQTTEVNSEGRPKTITFKLKTKEN